jgi:hypothetical protein
MKANYQTKEIVSESTKCVFLDDKLLRGQIDEDAVQEYTPDGWYSEENKQGREVQLLLQGKDPHATGRQQDGNIPFHAPRVREKAKAKREAE